ncbi:MAG: YihY family inner membrane protein [Chloroflexota bacterium]|nr:YihY family inner membrane protein [Chloroflexota bacterium]
MAPPITPRAAFDLLKTTYTEWSEDKASRLAASLAYYTAFSIAPTLLISIAIAGLIFGQEAAQGQVFAQARGLIGDQGAGAIETAVQNSSQQAGAGLLATIIGLATLLWSASNVFGQLQEALNTIWEVQPNPNAGIMATIKRRFLSMTMVLGIGFMLLVSLVLSTALGTVGNFFSNLLPGGAWLWQVINFAISFGVITLLFAAIYKVLPDATIKWSDVWIGAAVTALLFTVGKLLIGLYLGYASVGSTFGAAGSLLVFLVWVYYSAQILFFGAEFTQVYARIYGSHIRPAEDAVAMDEVVRAEQGVPHKSAVEKAAENGRARGRASDEQAESREQANEREKVGAASSRSTDARRSDGHGTNGHVGMDAHDDRRGARDGRDERRFSAPSLRPHSKWNKKANQVGPDGKKLPNRSERPAAGSKASLKSLIPMGLGALGILWATRDEDKKAAAGGKKRR